MHVHIINNYNIHTYIYTYINTYIRTYICTIVNTYIHAYIQTYICNSYNTPRRAVSDLQSPIPRARSARGGGDCKSDTAQLGVL